MKKLCKSRGLLPALLMVALLAACGGGGGNNAGNETPTSPGSSAANETPTTPAVSAEDDRPASADFFDILASDTHSLKGTSGGYTVETFYKDGMSAMRVEDSDGRVGRMIQRDGKDYAIDDDERTILIFDADEPSGTLPSASLAYVASGESEFEGKTLPYDEYATADGVRVWLFMDGNSLAGLRSFDDGESSDMVILSLDKNVPDGVFDLPEGYTEMEQ